MSDFQHQQDLNNAVKKEELRTKIQEVLKRNHELIKSIVNNTLSVKYNRGEDKDGGFEQYFAAVVDSCDCCENAEQYYAVIAIAVESGHLEQSIAAIVVDEYKRLEQYYAARATIDKDTKKYIIGDLKLLYEDKELEELELKHAYLKNIYEDAYGDLRISTAKFIEFIQAKNRRI